MYFFGNELSDTIMLLSNLKMIFDLACVGLEIFVIKLVFV